MTGTGDDRDRDNDIRDRVRERVLADHGDVVTAVAESADAVAAEFEGPITDGRELAGRLRGALVSRGVLDRLPAVIETAVAAAGRDLTADPVPAPPYVAVTARGPVLRATTDDCRVVVTLAVFRVERSPPRYVRTPHDLESVVSIEIKP